MNTQSNQHKVRARLALIAVGIAVCLIVSATVSGCSKAGHYRAHHDAESLFATLHKEIKPGDSIQRVEELLGKGEPPRNPEKLRAFVTKRVESVPQEFPDGVRDDDVFLAYRAGNMTIHLQVRGGRLINFNSKEYEKLPLAVGDIGGR